MKHREGGHGDVGEFDLDVLPVRGSGRDLKTCRSDRMRWPLRKCIHLLITQSRKKYKCLIL